MPLPPNGIHYCLDASTIDVLWQYIYDHYLRKTTEMGLTEIIYYEPNIGLFPDRSFEINKTQYIAFIEFCNRSALARTVYDSDNKIHYNVMGSTRWNASEQRYHGVVVSRQGTVYEIYVLYKDTHYMMYFLATSGGSVGDNGEFIGDTMTVADIIRACRAAHTVLPAYRQSGLSELQSDEESQDYPRVYESHEAALDQYRTGSATPDYGSDGSENYWK